MIAPSDARAIVSCLPVEDVARAAWRAASGDRDAAVVLDLADGRLRVLAWSPGSGPDVPPGTLVLAFAPAHRYADIARTLARGVEIPPSPEIVEEHVARLATEAFADDGYALTLAVEERLAAALARGAA